MSKKFNVTVRTMMDTENGTIEISYTKIANGLTEEAAHDMLNSIKKSYEDYINAENIKGYVDAAGNGRFVVKSTVINGIRFTETTKMVEVQ